MQVGGTQMGTSEAWSGDSVGTSDWPSLLFHFTVKRNSMHLYGRSEFSMYASPVASSDTTSVLFDAFATIDDPTAVYNYTLVNGVSYLQRNPRVAGSSLSPSVRCLRSDFSGFPPLHSILNALNEALPVTELSGSMGSTIKCEAGSIFKVSVDDFDFALCASQDVGFKMYGVDMDIEVEYLDTRVHIVAPVIQADDDNDDDECEADVLLSAVTPIGKSLLTGTMVLTNKRKLAPAIAFPFEDDVACTCKSKRRPCIFIHGLGVKKSSPMNLDSLPYWGPIADHAPCCSSMKYAHLNTVNHSWAQASQQQAVCDRALAVSNSSTNSTIRDTIVVTHSMGGLFIGGAIASGRCKLDPSSTWVSIAAPMSGSMGSDFAQDVCNGESNVFMEKIAEFRQQCPVNVATKSVAYENGEHSFPKLNKAYKSVQQAYRKHVSAAMCSNSYSGLLSTYQARFWFIGRFVPHKSEENDGTVEYASCTKGLEESKFETDYRSRFYRTKLNHFDMQFQSGDGLLNKAKMPVKWFECLL
uniref:GPI inositol-deacylase n=1 Tax=Peronospora matthiolae TaxID=2874970 RepID=A0AAV1V144_9STRA